MVRESGIRDTDPEDHAKDKHRLLSINTTTLLVNAPNDQCTVNPIRTGDSMTQYFHALQKIPCAGILMGLLAGIMASIASFIVKLLPAVNPVQIVIFRSMIQLLFYLPIVIWKRQSLLGVPGERCLLLARGAIGFAAFSGTYVAFRMIPLADVITIVFSAPIYVSIFACIFLSESCGLFQIITISLTICGTLLISKPTFLFDSDESVTQVHLRTEGTIIAFIASLLLSLTYICMRKLRKTSTAVIISVFSLESVTFGVIVLFILSTFFHEEAGQFAKGIGLPATMREAFLLCCNGICGCLGLLLMTVAMKIEEAGPMALVRSVDIVLAFMLQIAFLPDEVVHWTSLLGAVLVCTGVIVSGFRRWLKDKPGTCDIIWLLLTCGEERKKMQPITRQFTPESAVTAEHCTTESVDVNKNEIVPPV